MDILIIPVALVAYMEGIGTKHNVHLYFFSYLLCQSYH